MPVKSVARDMTEHKREHSGIKDNQMRLIKLVGSFFCFELCQMVCLGVIWVYVLNKLNGYMLKDE